MAGGQEVPTTHMWTPKGEHKVVNTADVKLYREKYKWTTEQPAEKKESK